MQPLSPSYPGGPTAPYFRPSPAPRPLPAPAVGFTGQECFDSHQSAPPLLTRALVRLMALLTAPFFAPLVWLDSSGRKPSLIISPAGDELQLYGLSPADI